MENVCFFEKEPVSLYLSNLKQIEEIQGQLQNVGLYMHPQLGKILIINDEIQHVEKWMPYYHEMLVHIPLMFLKRAQRVLILGGGDLYAAAEVLKYRSVARVDICDFDQNVIDISKKHYNHARCVLNDPRTNIIIMDAKKYIQKSTEKYDLIIDDCFNLVTDFKQEMIFDVLLNMLSKSGVCSSLVYRHIFDANIMEQTFNRLIYKHNTVLSLVTVPEYPGILHLLTIWGNSKYLSQRLKSTKNTEHKIISNKCKLFNDKFCKYYLYLPQYLRDCGDFFEP